MLGLDELGALIDQHHQRDLLRVQTRDEYNVGSDGEDYRRYLAGEAEPTWSRKGPWLDHLRSLIESGKTWRNVHVLQTPLSSYLRYACEWGYAYNVTAGQDIRILELSSGDLFTWLTDVGDFWVIDDSEVVQMHYDDGGRFVGADVIDDHDSAALHRSVAGLLWRQAQPFTEWWFAHPEFHRSTAAA